MQVDWDDSDDFDNDTAIQPNKKDEVVEVTKTWDGGYSPEEFTRFLEGKDKPLQPGITTAREALSPARSPAFLDLRRKRSRFCMTSLLTPSLLTMLRLPGPKI
jgi:hypothetical protein